MKKKWKIVGLIVLSLMIFTSGVLASGTIQKITADWRPDIKVIVDGQTQTFKDANGNAVYPITYNGSTYLPLRAIGGLMGKDVGWNGATNTVTLDTPKPTSEYSRTNPAPIGTAQTINLDSFVDGKSTVTIEITESYRGEEAWKKIKAANSLNSEAEDGKEYVLVKVKATVNKTENDKAISFGSFSFDAYSNSNVEYAEYTLVVDPSPDFGGNVFAGGTLEGYVTFAVDKTDTAPKIVYGLNYDGSGGIWFNITK